jgi:hypothetical protein
VFHSIVELCVHDLLLVNDLGPDRVLADGEPDFELTRIGGYCEASVCGQAIRPKLSTLFGLSSWPATSNHGRHFSSRR